MRFLMAAALVTCSACSPADEPAKEEILRSYEAEAIPVPGVAGETSDVPPAAMDVPDSLEGHWRVAGIDGEPFDEPYGLALTGDESSLWWEPECARQIRTYRIDGAAIGFETPDAPAPAAEGVPARPVCTIGLPGRLSDVFAALDAATRIERTPANGIEITGGGHSLTLFSQ